MSAPDLEARWISNDAQFGEVVDTLIEVEQFALDTEFHRERTYFPKLALLQMAWEPDGLVLVDPLKVDLTPLAKVFDGDGTVVIHAASQDLEVLQLACGTVPRSVFDTQIAAGFLGFSTPSLALLHERLLDVKLAKAERLTDWLHRPLSPSALEYAACDVRRLLEIRDILTDRLGERGRLDWALDECEEHRSRSHGQRDPETAWLKCKEARRLSGRAAAVAQAIGAWRERRAAELDIPVRYVLGDLGLVGIAQRPPNSLAALRSIRGVDARGLPEDAARSLLEAVERGSSADPPKLATFQGAKIAHDLKPAVSLVSSWMSQYAHELEIDQALLATRHDIEELIAQAPHARLSEGWRGDFVGRPIAQLLSGEAALAFDRSRGIILEARSGH